MSATSLLAITAISIVFEAFPITSHRFITNPYPLDDWNSVLVSSDPIKILDKKQNETTKPQKLRPIIRARKRSFNDCPENDFKCLYGTEEDKNNYFERPEGLLSSPVDKGGEEKDKNFTDGLKSSNSRKSYWNVINPQAHHHPFDDKNGWVTLDPVPWSSSKISKWHPNMEIHNNFHWSVNPSTTQRPAHQFWISGSNYKPEKPNVQWGIGTNGLITDNKPSGFPTGNFNGFASHGINQLPFNYHKQPFQKFPQNYELPGKSH